MFDHHLLDMMELGIAKINYMSEFKVCWLVIMIAPQIYACHCVPSICTGMHYKTCVILPDHFPNTTVIPFYF
jgi:hypothetical protein